jgi:hypothetical protein
MDQRAKFRGRDNVIVIAELVNEEDEAWEVVTYEKKSVNVYRDNREPKKKIGTTVKEVREVVKQLSNAEFKRQYFPANYAAVDLYDVTSYPLPEPKKAAPIPKPRPVIGGKQKPSFTIPSKTTGV